MTNTPAEVSPTIDLEGLERLAAEATPGPWGITALSDSIFSQMLEDGGANPIGFVYTPAFPERSEHGRKALNNTAYIAAANPQVVAALVAAVKAARDYAKYNAGGTGYSTLRAALQPFTVTK